MNAPARKLESLPTALGAGDRDRADSGDSAPGACCPDESLLLELSQGSLEGALVDSLLSHLDACADCGRIVAALAREVIPAAPIDAEESPQLKAGHSIDRFLLLDELGRGGMGVVYAAFDPTLDRKVALKLVRPAPSLPAPSAAAQLLAEAQALARLSHPNVVTVFEARARGEEVFLVMELIAGRSLRELAESRPGWRVLLDRFCDAGRGLAAAHDAGLVHRDFKPDNALLGDDGRVCVTDFGLAQPNRATRPSRAEPAGTPGYIAPELWLGEAADPRSDQFSFCVSLWEALFGARPFSAERAPLLLEQVRRGPQFPFRAAVPISVRRALLRGLRFDPLERHPSMRALLDELAQAPALRLSAPLLAMLGLALLGAGAGAHAVWLDARATPNLTSPTALAQTRTNVIEPAFSSQKIPSQQAWRHAEQFSRESFSPSGSPELSESGASTGALALNAPAVHPRVPRGTRSPPSPRRERAQPAANRSSDIDDVATIARASSRECRDGGIGGGSSGEELKGSSTLLPESDPLSGTRALR